MFRRVFHRSQRHVRHLLSGSIPISRGERTTPSCALRTLHLVRSSASSSATLRYPLSTMASAGITTDSGTKGSAPGSSRAAPVPITIDKSQFDTVRKTHGVEVTAKQCNAARKLLNTFIIRQRHQKPIVDSPSFVDEGTGRPLKRIILRPDIGSAQDTSEVLAKLSDEAREFIETHGLKIVPHEVHEGYDNLNAEQVLRKLLPAGVEVPTSFESVGHIAHFNLRDEQLPYRYLIGQVFLEKSNRQITTVLNKTGIIQTVFRTFPLEVIAGEPNTLVRVSEGGARFQFDYATVYWNSRLQFEHRRLVGVCDTTRVFCCTSFLWCSLLLLPYSLMRQTPSAGLTLSAT